MTDVEAPSALRTHESGIWEDVLIVRNGDLAADLRRADWFEVSVPNPNTFLRSPGLSQGRFLHPLSGAEVDPDLRDDMGWVVWPSRGALGKKSSEYLAPDRTWHRLSRSSQGRWFVFAHQEAAPEIPDDFDWENGSFAPYLPKLQTFVMCELEDDAMLFRLTLHQGRRVAGS